MVDDIMLDGSMTERRRRTRSAVYRYLYDSDTPCSKQKIAADLNLSLPTVYQNLTELHAAGLIDYCGAQPSSGGRPAMLITVVPDARISVGLSITERRLRFILTDIKRNELGYKDVHHQMPLTDPEFSRFLAGELELFLDENKIVREKLLGVGVTIAAVVSRDTSTIVFAPTLNLYNAPGERRHERRLCRVVHADRQPRHRVSLSGGRRWRRGADKRGAVSRQRQPQR